MNKEIQEIDRQIKECRRAAYNSPFTMPEQKIEAIKLLKQLEEKRKIIRKKI